MQDVAHDHDAERVLSVLEAVREFAHFVHPLTQACHHSSNWVVCCRLPSESCATIESDENLQLIFAPCSSLSGARPTVHRDMGGSRLASGTSGGLGSRQVGAAFRAIRPRRGPTNSVLVRHGDHGFLRLGAPGWSLSPAFDLNPVPTHLKARVLTTNIDSLESAAQYFGLGLRPARTIVKEVATVTATWREMARIVGVRAAEINRMASAFEHDNLTRALAL